jgi:hypothetical protein
VEWEQVFSSGKSGGEKKENKTKKKERKTWSASASR